MRGRSLAQYEAFPPGDFGSHPAGKPSVRGVRPLPFHCTRHSFITWSLEAGHSVKRVSECVGASVAVIEKNYSHAIPAGGEDLEFLPSSGIKGGDASSGRG